MRKLSLLFILLSFVVSAQTTSLKKEIETITKGKNATIAVSVNGINFPFYFHNRNASKKMPMLSVYKFHIALAVLHKVDEGVLFLDQNIPLLKSDLLENTWSPLREKYPEGNTSIPLSELINFTIAQSDNNGCDILLRLIGGVKTVQEFIDSKGISPFQIKYTEEEMHRDYHTMYENYTTTKALTIALKKFDAGKLLSPSSTHFLMQVMINTSTGANKLKEQLPKTAIIAHKTGSSGKSKEGLTYAENDAGIIQLPNGEKYSIAVLIKDSKETDKENNQLISMISKKVWDYLNQPRSKFYFYSK